MTRRLAVFLVGLTALGCDYRSGSSDRPTPRIDEKTSQVKPEELAAIVQANNAFTADLYQRLRGEPGNIFFSPFSIASALAMACGGARQTTAEQIAQTLHLPEDRSYLHPAWMSLRTQLQSLGSDVRIPADGILQFEMPNALWIRKGVAVRPEFTNLMQQYYEAALKSVDFAKDRDAACRGINEWIREQTHGRIREIVNAETLDPQVRLLLVSATFFQATWQHHFQKEATTDADFFPLTGAALRVPLMHDAGMWSYAEDADGQVVDLPYIGDSFVMTIYLPRKRDGLPEIEKTLTAGRLDAIRGREPKEVKVWLPRFAISSSYDLHAILGSMGMAQAFQPGAANFSGMSEAKDVYIGAAIHKASVDVSEKGTEAAAATVVSASLSPPRPDAVPEPVVFRADHPFFFLIRDRKSGTILFVGRLLTPR